MNKPLKLVLLFGTTVLTGIVAVVIFIGSFVEVITQNRSLAVFEVPGKGDFRVENENPSTITIWHDYQTIHAGKTLNHDEALPGGFEMKVVSKRGDIMSPVAASKMRSTMSYGTTSRIVIGTQEIPGAGEYELIVSGPKDQPRIMSVSEGSMGTVFAKIFRAFGIAGLLGLVGFVTLVLGIAVAFSTPRKQPPPF